MYLLVDRRIYITEVICQLFDIELQLGTVFVNHTSVLSYFLTSESLVCLTNH